MVGKIVGAIMDFDEHVCGMLDLLHDWLRVGVTGFDFWGNERCKATDDPLRNRPETCNGCRKYRLTGGHFVLCVGTDALVPPLP
jgi:hypothetical protein